MTNLLGCRWIFGERSILTAVAKHLLGVAFGIGRTEMVYTALRILENLKARIENALLGGVIKRCLATQHLSVKLGIYVNSVALH